MSSTPAQTTRNCVSCGRSISWDANVCPYCGHDFRMAAAGQAAAKKQTVMPVLGGVFILIVAVAYIIIGAWMAIGGEAFLGITLGASIVLTVCGAILILLGIIALLGGIFAVQRKHFALALLGGVLVIPSILGLVGLILVAVSHDEFT